MDVNGGDEVSGRGRGSYQDQGPINGDRSPGLSNQPVVPSAASGYVPPQTEAPEQPHKRLKPTVEGLESPPEPLWVLKFLKEHIEGFGGADDVKKFKGEVEKALHGLKVKVTHRTTNQKFTIVGLSTEDACDIYFPREDREGKRPPKRTSLLEYFKERWETDIKYGNIPCLELGRDKKSNKVPMEFCVLVEEQNSSEDTLKTSTLANPWNRRQIISEMVQAVDVLNEDVARNFEIKLGKNTRKVGGHVIGAPELIVGGSRSVKVDVDKCQWNFAGKSFVDGKSVDVWALIDFTKDGDGKSKLEAAFVQNLRNRCLDLGIQMAEPVESVLTGKIELSSEIGLEKILGDVVEISRKKSGTKLQLIVCVLTDYKDSEYKLLKWVSETRIGVVTQCCLASTANEGKVECLSNLCLKINAKLGGNNFQLRGKLLNFDGDEHVMFIGADVNHPRPRNKASPSIAAVVGTVNWPCANRYAARVSSQAEHKGPIEKLGAMCKELVETYGGVNKVKPKRIVVFRDGISEGEFEKVLGEEFDDLKRSIDDGGASITLVVVQKGHVTRILGENEKKGVPPGTVVNIDGKEFYLCSHYGGVERSKPTHYYVARDENGFKSDELQKLIYHLCFTFVRCTKPLSLVPPVYYAHLVAYRGRLLQDAAEDYSGQDLGKLHADLKDTMFFV